MDRGASARCLRTEPTKVSEGRVRGGHITAVRDERLPRINVWQAARYWAPGFVAHQSAMRDGELLKIPDRGDPPG